VCEVDAADARHTSKRIVATQDQAYDRRAVCLHGRASRATGRFDALSHTGSRQLAPESVADERGGGSAATHTLASVE